ncbi:endo-1,4-beta-xylanase 4-like isoform X2 [Primulina eburnea]|uniref:endo-1,4-beta-xylanase 4-like isoform X2 n=1 Tax=Primulina eburnea TaxID=1245227 RepID=UPI003C6CC193
MHCLDQDTICRLIHDKGHPCDGRTLNCIGTVTAKAGCWSFLKGGFVTTSPLKMPKLYLQNSDGKHVRIETASASLQPFTDEEWRLNQETKINKARKRAVTIHVSDKHGKKLQSAAVRIEQISNDFPFGSAIANTIIEIRNIREIQCSSIRKRAEMECY